MSEIDVRSCFTCEYLDNPVYTQECKNCWEYMNYKKKTEEKMDNTTSCFDELTGMPVSKKDNINPDHYKSETSLECIEAMEIIFGRDAVLDFCVCNAWKYIWRWKNKNGEEDLVKAGWYLSYAHDRMASDDWRYNLLRRMIHYISADQGVEVSKDG